MKIALKASLKVCLEENFLRENWPLNLKVWRKASEYNVLYRFGHDLDKVYDSFGALECCHHDCEAGLSTCVSHIQLDNVKVFQENVRFQQG